MARRSRRKAFGQAEFAIDLLANNGPTLGFPHSSQLDGRLRELRFSVNGNPRRITYFMNTQRVIVLLTVFSKTKKREGAEVRRAKNAMEQYMEHDDNS
jgi:hypothetical protein